METVLDRIRNKCTKVHRSLLQVPKRGKFHSKIVDYFLDDVENVSLKDEMLFYQIYIGILIVPIITFTILLV